MLIYLVIVHYKNVKQLAVSQVGYKTLEGAMNFIKSRSDYNGQPFVGWNVETDECVYKILDIQIED